LTETTASDHEHREECDRRQRSQAHSAEPRLRARFTVGQPREHPARGELVRGGPVGHARMVVALGPAVLLLSGCDRAQNALAPESHQARDIASLFWWMMGGAWIGLAVVVSLLVWSWKRRERRGFGDDDTGLKPGEKRAWYVVLGAGIVVPIVIIATLFVVAD